MAEKENEISLKVGEIPSNAQSDIGIGIVRLDTRAMSKIGVREGDVVEIEGKRKTGAIAIRPYPSDVGIDIIRMDGYTRRNSGTGIGEKVIVRKADVKEARKVVIAPAQRGVSIQIIGEAPGESMKRALLGRVVSKGDLVVPSTRRRLQSPFSALFGIEIEEMFGFGLEEMQFIVAETLPKGITKITEVTQVEVKPKAVEVKEEAAVPGITYEDIGGLADEVKKVREMIELPLKHPELFTKLGIEPPKGVLLHGPPGTGKTLLAKAVATESGANFYYLAGPEIMSKWYGESEKHLRDLFKQAQENAPSIIFIDEIDAIAPKREEVTGEVERRVVSQLLALMDGLAARGQVIVIAATNRINAIDPALRRTGRFDREIEIGVPDRKGRKEIFQIHTRNMPLEKDVDIDKLADITYGYVGADLNGVCKEAAMSALRRVLPKINLKEEKLPPKIVESLKVAQQDFQNALRMVEPSAMREVMVEVPKIKWNDIGDLDTAKQALKEMVEWPLKHPGAFKRLGIKPPRGILLYGLPGTGKTLLAKAVATESQANFLSVKGPEIYSKWVGESEKHVRDVFRKARQVAPAIIFLDEFDALAPKRGKSSDSGVTDRVVNQLLSEMDGLEGLEGVVVIAATNRPDIIDPGLLRTGRFDRHIYVPTPDKDARLAILKVHTKDMPLDKDVNLEKLADQMAGYVGSDIEAVCREAAINSLREDINSKVVSARHFKEAIEKVRPSVTKEDIDSYKKKVEKMKKLKAEEEISYYG